VLAHLCRRPGARRPSRRRAAGRDGRADGRGRRRRSALRIPRAGDRASAAAGGGRSPGGWASAWGRSSWRRAAGRACTRTGAAIPSVTGHRARGRLGQGRFPRRRARSRGWPGWAPRNGCSLARRHVRPAGGRRAPGVDRRIAPTRRFGWARASSRCSFTASLPPTPSDCGRARRGVRGAGQRSGRRAPHHPPTRRRVRRGAAVWDHSAATSSACSCNCRAADNSKRPHAIADDIHAGLVQMRCSPSPDDNVERAAGHIRAAAGRGAQVICLPELFAERSTSARRRSRQLRSGRGRSGSHHGHAGQAGARAEGGDRRLAVRAARGRRLPQHGGDPGRRRPAGRRLSQDAHPRRSACTTRSSISRRVIWGFAPSTPRSVRLGTLVCWDQCTRRGRA